MQINNFIPEGIKNHPIYIELNDLIQQYLDQTDLDLVDIKNKYRNILTLNNDVVREIFKEFGYDYINEVMELSEDEIRAFLGYLAIIHLLKGHKRGLELVLQLIGIQTELVEWWEEDPPAEPASFKANFFILDMSNVLPLTIDKLKEFIKNYVYPTLRSFQLVYEGIIGQRKVIFGGFEDFKYEDEINHFVVGWILTTGVIDHTVTGTWTNP